MKRVSDYQDAMAKCSHCAFCESVCPVFMEDLLETHVARSRIELIRAVLVDGDLPVTSRFKEIVDRCLLCTSCTQTCPAMVPVDDIVSAARHQIYKGKRMNIAKRFLVKQVMQSRGLKGTVGKLSGFAKILGVKQMPEIPPRNLEECYKGTIPAEAEKRGRVVYYPGCVTNTVYPDTGDAVIKVLTKNGFEVVIPEGLMCCGIPAIAEGDLDTACEMAKHNLGILAGIDADAVITDCTTCGMVFREKTVRILDENDRQYEDAQNISSRVFEVIDFLNQKGLTLVPASMHIRFTYHVPCHRGWQPTLIDAPRTLLSKIPKAERIEMEFPENCCGAGGAFYLEHKSLSEGILGKKIKDIKSTGAEVVVTQCPSCRAYLDTNLAGSMQVMHPVALMARAYEIGL